MLGMDTLLTLGGGGHRVRLSYVFEDDNGCRKGLTVRRLLPDPSSHRNMPPTSQRPGVHVAGGTRIGILDPEAWEREPFDVDNFEDQSPISAGALTCVFTISHGVPISSAFRSTGGRRTVDLADCAGEVAHFSDGARVGTILNELNHLRCQDQCIYPVLRLERSKDDLLDPHPSIRNGAMLATDEGALIGIVVSVFDAGKHYALAPIRDVLEWHGLRFLGEDVDQPEEPRVAAVTRRRSLSLRPQVSSKLRELVGV